MKSPRNQGFSLIELLTVIAVLSILTAISTPSLLSSRRAGQLTQSGNLLADSAALGRQIALSRNVITALLVAKTPTSDAPLIIVAALDRESNTWKPITTWSQLPDSIEIQDNTNDAVLRQAATDLASTANVRHGGNTVTLDTSLVFYPDGHMESHDSGNNSPAQRRLTVVLKGGDPDVNYYGIEFNKNTSNSRVVRPL